MRDAETPRASARVSEIDGENVFEIRNGEFGIIDEGESAPARDRRVREHARSVHVSSAVSRF